MRNRFYTLHAVLYTLSSLLFILSIILILPIVVVFLENEFQNGLKTLLAFLIPSGVSLLIGILIRLIFRKGPLSTVQAMLLCSLTWIVFSAIGAIPFVIGIDSGYLDGFFETMSGFTTTGITMYGGLEEMSRSILFWRSLTQWVGGLGILAFFLVILSPGGGAHRLFGAESHKIDTGRPVPGLAHTIKILWSLYLAFTCMIAVGLFFAGMSVFDAICHSFTALSTGGFSPYDASIEYYHLSGFSHYIFIEYVIIIGMFLGGTNFLIHYKLIQRDFKWVNRNTEFKYWIGFIFVFIAIILIEQILRNPNFSEVSSGATTLWVKIESQFRIVLFQVVSILTTTGFGTRDINSPIFGQAAKQLFLVMMVIGGCVGSTGGGFKVLRVGILVKTIQRELFRIRRPQSVSSVMVDGKPIASREISRIGGLFFMWILLLVIGGVTTAILSKHSAWASFSGMFSALGNIGPCYISVPNMAQLHPMIKIVYIFGMLAGRLEILPVLLLFSGKAWKS